MISDIYEAVQSKPRTVTREDGKPLALPRTALEQQIVLIMSDVLCIEQLGVEDNFFDLGGNSLLATQVVARIRRELGAEISLLDLFEGPTVAELGQQVEREQLARPDRHAPEAAVPLLTRVPRTEALPLSHAQQGIWLLDQLSGGTSYNQSVVFRLTGKLSTRAFDRAMTELLRRHESLRTNFELREGIPVQQIRQAEAARLPRVDLAGLPPDRGLAEAQRVVAADAKRPYDLARDRLLRLLLVRLATDVHLLELAGHHVVLDGWSFALLGRDLTLLYNDFRCDRPPSLLPLPLQYADYAAWQRRWLQGDRLGAEIEAWRGRLEGCMPLELPSDKLRPPRVSSHGGGLRTKVPADAADALRQLGQREGMTLFMVLLAAFKVLLARHTGQRDLGVGTVTANRTQSELEGLIGMFANTFVVRTDLSGDPPFIELLRRVRRSSLWSFEHQEVPYHVVVDALDPLATREPSHVPLVPVAFLLQNFAGQAPAMEGLEVESLSEGGGLAGDVRNDLTLFHWDTGAEIRVVARYNASLFAEQTISGLLARYHELLLAATRAPGLPLSQLAPEPAPGPKAAVEESSAMSLHQLFQQRVKSDPRAIAVEVEGEETSYRELDDRSGRLAHRLRELGVAGGVVAALRLQRPDRLLAGMLATLKAGGAYLALEQTWRGEPLDELLSATGATVLLSDDPQLSGDRETVRRIRLDQVEAELSASSPSLCEQVDPTATAMAALERVGSGPPKIRRVSHAAAARATRLAAQLEIGSADRVAVLHELAGPSALCATWGALLRGAVIDLLAPSTYDNLDDLVQALRSLAATRVFAPPTLLDELARCDAAAFAAARTLVAGGETRIPRLATALAGASSTELAATVESSGSVVGLGRYRQLADGQEQVALEPLPGLVLRVLGPDGEDLAPLAVGELSTSDSAGRTGLLGRRLHDDCLDIIGTTHRLPRCGSYLVDLRIVESLLRRYDGILDAVVRPQSLSDGRRGLVAYLLLEPAGPAPRSEVDVSAWLAQQIPRYMTPESYHVVEALPLTPAGALDEEGLPSSTFGQLSTSSSDVLDKRERLKAMLKKRI